MPEIAKLRVTPIVGTDRKLYRHANLMPGIKFEDLTAADLIKAEKEFVEMRDFL